MIAPNVAGLLDRLERDRRDRGGVCATCLNVIAFIERDEQLLHWMAESGEAFAEARGFRVVLLDGSSGPQTSSVRTRCKDLGDTRVTSLEQVLIGVKDVGAAALQSVVRELLVPNVRTVVLWAGERLRDERFDALANAAETIVLFSAGSATALECLRDLARLQATPIAARIRDLAYMRLLPWQDLTAQFFDDPDLAAELPLLTGVEIASGSQPEAYYLAAWLASRLGWEPCGNLLFCSARGAQIRASFREEGPPRRIRAIRLRSPECTFSIAVSPEAEDLICLSVDGNKRRPLRCLPLHDVDIVSLLERAIFSPEDAGVYSETLGVLARLFACADPA